jgi:hypothetical protein
MEMIFGLLARDLETAPEGWMNAKGVFVYLSTPSLPFSAPDFATALWLRASPLEKGAAIQAEVQLVDPDGNIIDQQQGKWHVPLVYPLVSPIITCGLQWKDITFQREGAHRFEVLADNQQIGQIDFEIWLDTTISQTLSE